MKAAERRKAIVNLLLSSNEAISGSTLSEKFGVSRQIIVQDITVLKGLGYEIDINDMDANIAEWTGL